MCVHQPLLQFLRHSDWPTWKASTNDSVDWLSGCHLLTADCFLSSLSFSLSVSHSPHWYSCSLHTHLPPAFFFFFTCTLLHSNFFFYHARVRGGLSVCVRMWVCQHVEMGFDSTVLSKCEFPSSLSFPLTEQRLGFWLFHLSVAEHHLINNDWLIDFSLPVPSITLPLSPSRNLFITLSLKTHSPYSSFIPHMILILYLFPFLSPFQ